MQQLIYVSDKAESYLPESTVAILESARNRNAMNDITGLLVETGHNFFQILEGSDMKVQEVFSRISQDARHQNIRVIYQHTLPFREFGQWAMGYASDLELQQISDAIHLLNEFARKDTFNKMEGESLKMLLSGLTEETS